MKLVIPLRESQAYSLEHQRDVVRLDIFTKTQQIHVAFFLDPENKERDKGYALQKLKIEMLKMGIIESDLILPEPIEDAKIIYEEI